MLKMPINILENYLKFWLYLDISAINLIFCIMRLENFMTSCRDKQENQVQFSDHCIWQTVIQQISAFIWPLESKE